MFLVYRRGLKLDGNNPVLLFAYGGFNATIYPEFSALRLALLEQGFVYAYANIRGGGEYGEKWHEDGSKLKKQNVFDDFIAAGEWLVANKYTSREKLARSEEHTSELQSRQYLVCRLLLEKKKTSDMER